MGSSRPFSESDSKDSKSENETAAEKKTGNRADKNKARVVFKLKEDDNAEEKSANSVPEQKTHSHD